MKAKKKRIKSGRNGIDQDQNSTPKSLQMAYRILSRRECQILKAIAENRNNREISEQLFISKKTVENHITNIGKALNLRGRGAVRKWVDYVK